MYLRTLRVRNLRSLSCVDLELGPGINIFVGGNGAGKTSVLEAAYLLSHAQSFRSGPKDALVQRGANELSVFAELQKAGGQINQVGLGFAEGRWSAKFNGTAVALGKLVQDCAAVCFDPGTHALIAGGGEYRRRFLNWGVFHVEPTFLEVWRRYERALKQRNRLLRTSQSLDESLFHPWERELDETASVIDRQRRSYLEGLRVLLQTGLARLLPELGTVELRYRRGWPEEMALESVLDRHRSRDFARGHTGFGIHRADWSLTFDGAPVREHLSRGQEKLAALACVLAQARLYADKVSEWPVVCLDDFASELDDAHQETVAAELLEAGAQVLVSGTHEPATLRNPSVRRFHVEQGVISRLL